LKWWRCDEDDFVIGHSYRHQISDNVLQILRELLEMHVLRGVLVCKKQLLSSHHRRCCLAMMHNTRDSLTFQSTIISAKENSHSRNRSIRNGHNARKHNLSPPCVVSRQAPVYHVAFSNKKKKEIIKSLVFFFFK